MKIIKFNTAWAHSFFYERTPNALGIIGDYKFEINNDCNECDYWIIWGDLPPLINQLTVKCNPQNIYFITDEVHENKLFHPNFLNQFSHVLSPRNDINKSKLIHTHELNTWLMGRTYDEIISEKEIIKSKKISMVSSDLTDLVGHKKRFAFANKLIGHFKDRLDVFGRGFNFIENKYDALAPYKYSIAIENNVHNGYFTEKLTECFLSDTMPIYYGCPNLNEYFDTESMLIIDIDDYKKSIDEIERLLEEDPYESKLELIKKQKRKYLSSYHIFPAIVELLEGPQKQMSKKINLNIKSNRSFYRDPLFKRVFNRISNL